MIVTTPAACQHLEVPKRDNSLDDDPGWPSIKTLFLLFIPIVGGAAARRAGRINGTDGLLMLRQTWQSFFGALVVVGLIVPLLTMNADGETADPWLALVALTTAGLVGAHLLVGGQSLDGSDSTRLFRSYRKRFFVRSGLVAAMGLVALLAALAAKQWWLYWIVAPIALAVSTLHAPTSRNLRTDQERLSQRGCMLPLNRSLRSFGQS